MHEVRKSQESLAECSDTNDDVRWEDHTVENCAKLLDVHICSESVNGKSGAKGTVSKQSCVIL